MALCASMALCMGIAGWAPAVWIQDAKPGTQRVQPLARYFPDSNLVVLAEFDGTANHVDLWNPTAAHAILSDTPTGAMLRKLGTRVLELALANAQTPLTAAEILELVEHALKHGFAFGIVRKPDEPKPSQITLVIRGGAAGVPKLSLGKLLGSLGRGAGNAPVSAVSGRQIQLIESRGMPPIAWWFEGADLAVSLAGLPGAEVTIATLDGKNLNATRHERRTRLASTDGDFSPIGWAFFDMAALPALPPDAQRLGLGGLRRFEYRWGVEGKAIKTVLTIEAPAPRTGLLAFFDFGASNPVKVPSIPSDLTALTLLSLKPEALLANVLALEATTGRRDLAQRVADITANIKEHADRDLITDVLKPIGPGFAFYSRPPTDRAAASPLAGAINGYVHTPQSVLLAQLGDAQAYADTLDRLMPELNKDLSQLFQRMQPGELPGMQVEQSFDIPAAAKVEMKAESIPIPPVEKPAHEESVKKAIEPNAEVRRVRARDTLVRTALITQDRSIFGPQFVKVNPPLRGWMLDRPLGGSFLFGAGARPTILVANDSLIIGSSFEIARDAASSAQNAKNPGALAERLKTRLADGAIFVHTSDPRDSIAPLVLSNLPGLLDSMPIGPALTRTANNLGMGVSAPFALLALGSFAGGGGLNLSWLPEELPTPDAIAQHLFPAEYSFTADAAGFRFESREAFPTFNPITLLPVAGAMLFPAVSSAREAAQRAQSINNLKQIGLAIHNFHDAFGRMPSDIRDAEGKPILSWRVELLQFLENPALAMSFQRDEPWDGPNNKALIESMPTMFAVPGGMPTEPGHTFYRSFAGVHTAFEHRPEPGLRLSDFTDGTSNTIAVVEARESVPWTKPDSEVPVDPNALDALPALLGGHFAGGFNALFMDGSVRFLRDTINPHVLGALVTRDGGEVIDQSAFQ